MQPSDADIQAALERCAREPIHRLGLVQSHGAVMLCDPVSLLVRGHTSNCADVLGIPAHGLVGTAVTRLLECPDLRHDVDGLRAASPGAGPPARRERRVRVRGRRAVDVSLHIWGDVLVVEAQRPVLLDASIDVATWLDAVAGRLGEAGDLAGMLAIAASEARRLTGYERTLIYRFDPEWNGEVIAEASRQGDARYLGLHFPASDIPPQARRLFETSPLRVIADTEAEPVGFEGWDGPEAPDLSHATLRASSPVHIQYLRNMGVRSSIAVSLMVDGRLWGLLVAHHDRPGPPAFDAVRATRSMCRVLGHMIASRIISLEYGAASRRNARLLDLLEALRGHEASEASLRDVVAAAWPGLRDWFGACGLAAIADGAPMRMGRVPGDGGDAFAAHFRATHPHAVAAVTQLPDAPGDEAVAGALWLPFGAGRNALLLFREAEAVTTRWGGAPQKTIERGPDGPVLTPRHSFAEWAETHSSRCRAWAESEIDGARRVAAKLNAIAAGERRRESERRADVLLEGLAHVSDPLMILDARREAPRVIFANRALRELLGDGDGGSHCTPAFLDPHRVGEDDIRRLLQALESDRPSRLEFAQSRADGRRVWVELQLAPMVDADGGVTHWVAVEHDLSERKAEEARLRLHGAALKQANERYNRILALSDEAILTVSDTGRVDFANSRAGRLFGRPLSELLGARIEDVVEDERVARSVLLGDDTGVPLDRTEIRIGRPDGTEARALLACAPLRTSGSDASGWLLMLSDVTGYRGLEDSLRDMNASLESQVAERTCELQLAKEAADAANSTKTEFLANMSHELRSPLHSILGFSRLLLDDVLEGPGLARNYLEKVERSARNLLALVNDLLDTAKIESNNFYIARAPMDLADTVRAVVGELEGQKAVGIAMSMPDACPMHGDALRIAQVVRNLLTNSLKFSSCDGPIQVGIDEDEGWRLAIDDQGPGIPPDELDLVFERFSQSSTTKNGAGGSGLGLHIARGIVQAHGGRIWAENRPEGGARFLVVLPRSPDAPEASVPDALAAAG